MNNRVVANGTPLADRFDNVARVARRAGYDPTLFGYTDTGVDPLVADGPDDPRLDSYDGVLPGFSIGLRLPEDQCAVARVARGARLRRARRTGSTRCAASPTGPPSTRTRRSSPTAFSTGSIARTAGWFAHAVVPAPALAVRGGGGVRARATTPPTSTLPIAPPPTRSTRCTTRCSTLPERRGTRRRGARCGALRAQYFGMVTEVDAQLGRVLDAIRHAASGTTPSSSSPPTTASSSATTV